MGSSALRPFSPRLALPIVCLLSTQAAAQELDAELVFNQRFHGFVEVQTDVDLIKFSEVEGSKLTITAVRTDGLVKPRIELLDSTQTPINTSGFEVKKGKKVQIKKFPVPATGDYFVRIDAANGLIGTYKVTIKGKPIKKVGVSGTIGAPGEIDEVKFVSRAGGTLSGTLKRASGDIEPALVEVVAPDGSLVSIFGKSTVEKQGATLKFSGIDLPLLGEYTLRFTGLAGTTGGYSGKLTVKPPKPVKGKVFEAGHPADPGNLNPAITLVDVFFGRGLRQPDGLSMDVVNPLSLVVTDPISDLPVPGTLEPLFSEVSLDELFAFHLGPLFSPPVVPRNGVLVLRFDKPVSKASLNLVDGKLGPDSPILLTVNGGTPEIEVFVSGKDVILNPVTGDQTGFPPSPVVLDAQGNPVASVTGNGQLWLLSKGENQVKSLEGGDYKPRSDLLGSPDAGGVPIGFNPGNQVLDFFKQAIAGGVTKGYSGFLPDERRPRIIREFKHEGVFSPDIVNPQSGDILLQTSFSIVSNEAFDTQSKGGNGEWAGGVLRLRPNAPNEEELLIERNTVMPLGGGLFRNEFFLSSKVKVPLQDGQPYEVVRAEYFEPDPQSPLDLDLFDPLNPENDNNTDLLNFVEIRDENGVLQDPSLPVDPRSSITIRFNEPMAEESFRPYESFFVTDDPPSPNFGINKIGRVVLSEGGKVVTYSPEREIQFGALAGTVVNVGFGRGPLALRFHVKVVPPAEVIQGHVGEQGLNAFLAQGERGVTDVGGQPLAFPLTSLSPSQLTLDYSFAFATAFDASVQDHGAVVHRFKGQPQTGFDAEGNTGVIYQDMPPEICGPVGNVYGPRIADLNLFANGFLAGAPVQFIQKIHDDFNPPPTGQLSPFPFGTTTPIGGAAVLGGCRFIHVYRAVDASPDWEALRGTILDLSQVAFAPIGGGVTNTTIPDFQVHAGHSRVVPDTKQGGGIPSMPQTGLCDTNNDNAMGGHFSTLGDPNTNYVKGAYDATLFETGEELRRQICYGSLKPGAQADFYDGKPFTIDGQFLFQPPGTNHTYHPIPHTLFDNFFPYNNGADDVAIFNGQQSGHTGQPTWGGNSGDHIPQSLLLEYRVRVVDPDNPPAQNNGFTFAVGILSSALPRFRVYSMGVGCSSCCTSGASEGGGNGGCKNTCSFAPFGPAMTGLPSSGGPPLEPDMITHAAGPDPAPPGLNCYCLQAPNSPTNCTTGSPTNQNSPSITDVAYGNASNPSQNNFGDNSRYFMVFQYIKRESTIRSPFVRAQPAETVDDPIFLAPIFEPPLSELPVGTSFDVTFRASTVGLGQPGDSTVFITPEEMADVNNAINSTPGTPFIQFEAISQGNTTTQLSPVIEEVIIPFRDN